MTTPDPYWCAVCHERHVVPSIARTHENHATEAPVNPDCKIGKCQACSGTAWDDDRDEVTACSCRCHTTPVGRRPAAPAPDNERNVTGL